MLGIIGGMGPQAGMSLYGQILAHTPAQKDQAHIPTILWSTPHRIPDRSAYLLGESTENPAYPVADIALQLEQLGVCIVGIPCNTFHAAPIWTAFAERLTKEGSRLQVLHLVQETVAAIQRNNQGGPIGVLGTLGTYQSGTYSRALQEAGIEALEPAPRDKARLHDAIYNPYYGIKALHYIGPVASDIIRNVAESMHSETLLLGCTELCIETPDRPGSFPGPYETINPLAILAQAMVNQYGKTGIAGVQREEMV
jgi:aspartate racemase